MSAPPSAPTAAPRFPLVHDFTGLWIPLITPFGADLSVDKPALRRLLEHYRQWAIAGWVIHGTTGEPSSLSAAEQLANLDLALENRGDKRIIGGVSAYSLQAALDGVALLNTRPVAGVLVSAPSGIRPSQQGLMDWFTRIAEASTHPVMVYDIPYRTGATITRETLMALAEHPNIAAVKDCGGDAGKTLALMGQGRLQVLAGDDLQMFSCIAQGGVGAIAASAHLHTDRFVALLEMLQQGDLANARSIWHSLVPWVEQAFAAPNPAPVKAALAVQGLIDNVLRPPLQAVPADGFNPR